MCTTTGVMAGQAPGQTPQNNTRCPQLPGECGTESPETPMAPSSSRSGSGSKILVVGSGGREHALALRLLACPSVGEVIVAPGNAGTRATPPGAEFVGKKLS